MHHRTLFVMVLASLPAAAALSRDGEPGRPILRASSIEGVQCRLIPDKTTWPPDESPRAKACIQSSDSNSVWLATVIGAAFELQVDDRSYRWAGPQWLGVFGPYDRTPWLAGVGGFLTVPLDGWCWRTCDGNEPLAWQPGEHRVRIAWAGQIAPDPDGQPDPNRGVLLVSDAASIEIEPGRRPGADNRQDEVTWLFDWYVRAEAVTPAQESAGMKVDLRAHHEWHPCFQWRDIPALLALADRAEDAGKVPYNLFSSYRQDRCRQGMVALWLIEGLRCKQAAVNEALAAGRDAPRVHYLFPLNPLCRGDDVGMTEAETSAEIHQKVLAAYRRWWEYVRSMPAEHAAGYDPLGDTGIRWFTGRTFGRPLTR